MRAMSAMPAVPAMSATSRMAAAPATSALFRFPFLAALVCLAAGLFCASADAQDRDRRDIFFGGSASDASPGRYVIRNGLEDELLVDVQIWGQVHRPGQYSVPDRTDLIGLMSYAGGPTEDAKIRKIQIVSPIGKGPRVQTIDVESFVRTGDSNLIPTLHPGDVVVVPASRSHNLYRWGGIISVAALVANVAILATRN
ncbi:MAG: polysaccharide biosynthesis/export family protein [Candidatus Eisenbacteria bacterium]